MHACSLLNAKERTGWDIFQWWGKQASAEELLRVALHKPAVVLRQVPERLHDVQPCSILCVQVIICFCSSDNLMCFSDNERVEVRINVFK